MDFHDYAWHTVFQITKKEHQELKILLRDDISFPILGKDKYGYVICLAKPRITRNEIISFQGLFFNQQEFLHKKILWEMFKASVFHLSLHAAFSDFEAYKPWAKNKEANLATYVASVLEDAVINAYLKELWTPLIPDIAYANAISHLQLKPATLIPDKPLRVMTAILSKRSVGGIKGRLPQRMKQDVDNIVLLLHEIEKATHKKRLTTKEKIKVAEKIYARLSKYGETSEVPSLPYTENHGGKNEIFYRKIIPADEEIEIKKLQKRALDILNPLEKRTGMLAEQRERLLENEVSQLFSEWERKRASDERLLAKFKDLGSSTHFSSFEFPREDYVEYIRRKAMLSGPIRRILNRLRLLKNKYGEDFRHEDGLLDLQEAIQVVASRSQRTDVFVRDELQTLEEAWAILIDASRSLNFFAGEVRGIALCLAEVAKQLILNQEAWSMFAFSNKFYVIKDFSEAFSRRVRARIGGLKYGGVTYLPDGVALVAEALKKRTEESRILVVVSDFLPSGYEGVEEALRRNIKQIERFGIGVIGIGVRSQAVERYLRLRCVVETPYELMKKFAKALLEYSALK